MAVPINSTIINNIRPGGKFDDKPVTYAIGVDPGGLGGDATGGGFTDPPDIVSTSSANRVQIRAAFELWDDVMGTRITETPGDDDADITVNSGVNFEPGVGGVTYSTVNTPVLADDADIFLKTNAIDPLTSGGRRYFSTALHEIGHSLGLKHPGDYDASDDESITYANNRGGPQDTVQFTIMSYFNPNNYDSTVNWSRNGTSPQTPMIYDILAIQSLYGANLTTRTGNTTYGFGENTGKSIYDFNVNRAPVMTLWDAGGNDTLNLSGFTVNQRIDLNPGTFSDVGRLPGPTATTMIKNLGIAFNTWIENAVGGSGRDNITGNNRANKLSGEGDNDKLFGDGAADTLSGGAGNDELRGGTGIDTLTGGTGDDDLRGGSEDDTLDGGLNNDKIYGEGNNDRVIGNTGNDWLYGGTGNDTLFGADGDDIGLGEAGNDIISGGFGNDTLNGGTGNDVINGDTGNDVVFGLEGTNSIQGGTGNDRWDSSAGGINTVNLGSGDDRYILGAGSDKLADGVGFDTVEALTQIIGNWQTNVFGGLLGNDNWLATAIDRFKASAAADVLIMKSTWTQNFEFIGGAGADILTGANGRDLFEGGTGSDIINGGGGIDTVTFADHFGNTSGGWSIDLVSGKAVTRSSVGLALLTETDTLFNIESVIGSQGSDAIQARQGSIAQSFAVPLLIPLIDGGAGTDTLTLSKTIANPTVSGGQATANDFVTFSALGAAKVETATVVSGGLLGASLPAKGHLSFKSIEKLDTGVGDDTIINAKGKLFSIIVSPTNVPVIDGGTGTDTLNLSNTVANPLAAGGQAVANDTVVFSAAGAGRVTTATVTAAGAKANSLLDFKSIEKLYTGDGLDKVTAAAGNEIVFLGSGNDVATLGLGADQAFGEAGNDNLDGGDGNDSLMGGTGTDTLKGGAGADKFFFVNTGDGTDVINDFATDDFLVFKGSVFGTLPVGTLAATRFWTNATGVAHDADDRFVFNTTDDTLWYDANGNAAGGAFKMADMNITFNLTAADIQIA